MAYNTKSIVTDKDGNPISQYYNPDTDSYEPVEGSHGANKVLVVNNDLSLIPVLEKLSQLTGTVIDEETRKSNEDIRKSNEDIRKSNELQRIENEDIRISQEESRVLAEKSRESNETIRQQNENERESNEVIRVSNEEKRIQNESNRVSAEIDRVQAELDRQEGYNQAINDFNTQGQQAINDFNTQGQQAINDFVTETERVEAIYPTRLTNVENDLAQHKLDYASQRQQDQLKLAKVEKDINDYKQVMSQVNINQEAKQNVSGYEVISLPKNAANGQISATVAGQTATNLAINGKGDSTEGWLKQDQVTITEDGFYEIDTSGIVRARLRAKTFAGRKYLLTFVGRCISGSQWALQCYLSKGGSSTADDPTSASSWGILLPRDTELKRRYAILSPTDDGEAISITKTGLGEGEPTKYKLKEIMLFDVTDMEGTDEEIFNEINSKFPYYFSGTKSTVSAIRLKSVGKNLLKFAPNNVWDGQVDGKTTKERYRDYDIIIGCTRNGLIYRNNVNIHNIDYLNNTVKLSTTLAGYGIGIKFFAREGEVLKASSSIHGIGFFDKHGNVISHAENKAQSSYIVPVNTSFCIAVISSNLTNETLTFSNFMVEKGTVATPYEPYTESTQYITAKDESGNILELRSLPNGTKDEINVTDRKLIKRIGEKSNIANGMVIDFADMAEDGTYYAWNDDGETEAGVKGDTLGIDATDLIYQLAMPVETPVQVSGTLVSYPSGTVYIEPYVADAGIYTDKMEVLHSDLPIKALEKISKVDFATGLETELDITAAVIAEDKLSFTHPDLTSGDIVFFVYEHGAEGTIPETEISYYDSRYVIQDSVTGKFYKWKIAVANGTPTIELEEV